ncbi:MAG: chromate efflux transporter [Cyclobacteriaceae bacterium]|nr:chromate efflux transporter [Cyclobacteriaceae bacterium]
MTERVPYPQFLKDVFQLSISCFGGPQAHLANYQRILVEKRNYLTEPDLMELYALCQIVPGPTSTQTLTSVGYRLGGPSLAYLTLIIWMLPSVAIMTLAGILVGSFQEKEVSLEFTRFIQPMAVGFVGYAAYTISLKTVNTKIGFVLMVASAVASYFIKTPLVFPIILIIAGTITAFNYKLHPKEEKKKFDVPWANFFLWAGVFIVAAALGGITKALPIKLFENFYRNGSLVFGGGQVLVPMLYTEFVQYAKPLHFPTSPSEFLSGYAFVQAVPGPVFSFSAYIGALSMREWGTGGEILGALMSAAGIFLPGTFLIFFVIRIWDSLKKFRPIRASLEGINAANAGLVAAAAVLLFQPLQNTMTNFGFMIATFCLLAFTKLPAWSIIGTGLILGFVLT